MARGATQNKREHQSISELPNQTWWIISVASTPVHEQKDDVRVNKVIHLISNNGLCKCSLSLRDSQAKKANSNKNLIESLNLPTQGNVYPIKIA